MRMSSKSDAWKPSCGAFVLTPAVLITASHCLGKLFETQETYRLVAGCRDVSDAEEDHKCQVIDITRKHVLRHPKFDQKSFENDIGVIKLPRPFQMTTHAKHPVIPLCLPPKNFDWRDHIGQLGYLAGWGKTEEGSVSDDLNTVALNITAIDVCKDTYDPKRTDPTGFDDKTMICAVGSEGHDSCEGDSGGPLMMKIPKESLRGKEIAYEDKRMMAIGLTSFNNGGCGQGANTPGVYTNLVRYLDWLHEVIKK